MIISAIQQNLPLFWAMMVLHCIIGTLAAFLAKRKGFNFKWWLAIGLIGGTFAFVSACFLQPASSTLLNSADKRRGG
ncbi:hypothetical protein [Phormidium sp. CCY1219]|uniref:hypothetical protein n=1 Tax=Phormidium sp. CCY1219 TaxID=2886104 RepID=UPI002D1EE963|nr:hypothetical protein [Phormidium sp. CCY1219]MEB3828672.1 hypothetical protein [Phormidium sp. CCY1219]